MSNVCGNTSAHARPLPRVRSGSGDYENATRVPGTGDWLELLDRRGVPKRMGEIEERIEGAARRFESPASTVSGSRRRRVRSRTP